VASDGFTIGEVLNQLKGDFEDITISKIRFLESEGLISPRRTESGYRKFTDDDVDRLRFILTAQRDHYLPLRVIRQQLERVDAGEGSWPPPSSPPAVPGPSPESSEAGTPGDGGPLGQSAPAPPARDEELSRALEHALAGGEAPALDQAPARVTLTLRELCEATGLDPAEVRALRDFGVIGERGDDGAPFDGDDLLAARAARELLVLGLEARHLRMYRQFVDRELALFEQLVNPLLLQRNPGARRLATEQLERVAALTGQMKRSLLARALRQYLQGGA
jgi:DNA-binding transcriptional MerR regulator